MNNQHVDDLLDLYALGALEPDEEAMVEAHLATCALCQSRLAEAKRVVELLPWTPEQREPPPQLRARVLDHVARLQRAEGPPQPTLWERIRHALRPPVARLGMGLSVALLLVSLGLGIRTWQQQQQLSTLWAQVAQQQEALDLLRSPDVQVASLTPADAGGPRAQLVFDASGQRAYLVTAELPPLPADQTYQIWLIDEQPNSAGLFTVDAQGTGAALIQAPQPIGAYEQIGISREPAGGSPTPTPDQIVLLGPL